MTEEFSRFCDERLSLKHTSFESPSIQSFSPLSSPTLSNATFNSSSSSLTSSLVSTAVATPTGNSTVASFHAQSHLKPGNRASLLSAQETLSLYRRNAERTSDVSMQMEFSLYLLDMAKQLDGEERETTIQEAIKVLRVLSVRGLADAKYLLAECYLCELKNAPNKKLASKRAKDALALYIQASKQSHVDAAFEAARCYEKGIGTRRDACKSYSYYLKAASAGHPGAAYRLALAELNGELGRAKNVRNGCKWMHRAADAGNVLYPEGIYHYAKFHENGIPGVIFQDEEYALSLYARAAELGHALSAFRIGCCYDRGEMGAEPNLGLAIHYYLIAAAHQLPEACFALATCYLMGDDEIPCSDLEAYCWALRAAELCHPSGEYTVGYFLERGIGVEEDLPGAIRWYCRAADHGEKRAAKRLEWLKYARADSRAQAERMRDSWEGGEREEVSAALGRAREQALASAPDSCTIA
ncbi:uncharacterized protein VTP21DRAFT_4021 [Calcarisporiella thermophila]|uniref:uncharacterized protein n=1 Tax=Calcarisporiella thermophila TaxID=911321 RepID=UPI003742CE57